MLLLSISAKGKGERSGDSMVVAERPLVEFVEENDWGPEMQLENGDRVQKS